MLRMTRAATVPDATWTNPEEAGHYDRAEAPAARARPAVAVSDEAKAQAEICRSSLFLGAAFTAVVGLPEMSTGSAALTGSLLLSAIVLPALLLRKARREAR